MKLGNTKYVYRGYNKKMWPCMGTTPSIFGIYWDCMYYDNSQGELLILGLVEQFLGGTEDEINV